MHTEKLSGGKGGTGGEGAGGPRPSEAEASSRGGGRGGYHRAHGAHRESDCSRGTRNERALSAGGKAQTRVPGTGDAGRATRTEAPGRGLAENRVRGDRRHRERPHQGPRLLVEKSRRVTLADGAPLDDFNALGIRIDG